MTREGNTTTTIKYPTEREEEQGNIRLTNLTLTDPLLERQRQLPQEVRRVNFSSQAKKQGRKCGLEII